jgi:hypothetical protein
MTLWSHAIVGLAIAVAAATTQWPAPSSQPATAPPAAEQPVQSAEGGAVVTLTGCIRPTDPGAATTGPRATTYVLSDVTDLGSRVQATDPTSVTTANATSTAGDTTRTRPAERYALIARDTGIDLSRHVSGRVQVTGTVGKRTADTAGARDDSRGAPTSSQPGGAGAQHTLPTLTVHSITTAEGRCGQ